MDYKELANGVSMPQLGLGVWRAQDGLEATNAVEWALKAGYRAIDTAAIYGNEESVGKGIVRSGVARKDIFLTSKVWNNDQGYEKTIKAFEASLERLGTDYLDLYLIHWPVTGKSIETWRALEELYASGRVRAIGVSNFSQKHLEHLLANCKIKPMINQVELHPELTQEELRSFCKKEGILIEAWSPLGQGQLLSNDTIKKIAASYGKSPAQVILRWDIQNDIVTIPKSVTKNRIIENIDVFDFELSEQDLLEISNLNRNNHLGTDPDTIEVE